MHAVALMKDSGVKAWGGNMYGQFDGGAHYAFAFSSTFVRSRALLCSISRPDEGC